MNTDTKWISYLCASVAARVSHRSRGLAQRALTVLMQWTHARLRIAAYSS